MTKLNRLNGVDAAFLYLETPTMHMHIVGAIVLDPSTMPDGYSYERMKKLVRSKIHRIPPFYQKLRRVPLDLEHPYWVPDPDFDIDRHVYRVVVPEPGGSEEFGKLVGEIAAKPLDRSRPLWELWVVEGLENGEVALITKMHHAAGDGMASGYLMLQLLSMTPEIPDIDHPQPVPQMDRCEIPTNFELVRHALKDRIKDPSRIYKQTKKTISRALGLVDDALKRGTENFSPGLPFMAPRTMLNGSLTSRRMVAFGQAPLEDFKYVKGVYGCKVNDVVLAATTYALRRYLQDHDDLPKKALIASCPVSVRKAAESSDFGNRVSTLFARLPVHVEDPVETLKIITLDTKDAKHVHKAMGAEMLTDWARLAAPLGFMTAARMYSRMKLADKHTPIHNLIVSNVPGPPFTLYCLGAKVTKFFPLGPILEGAGLNVTVVSSAKTMNMGLVACPDTVPDVGKIGEYFAEGIAVLKERAEAKERADAAALEAETE